MHRYAHCNRYITEKLETVSTHNIKEQLIKLCYMQKGDTVCNHLRYLYEYFMTWENTHCVILNFKNIILYTG